jgi:hypothetical protein
VVVRCIETLAPELRNTGALDCDSLVNVVRSDPLAHVGPQSETDCAEGVVDEGHILANFLVSLAKVDHFGVGDFCNHAANVKSLHLLNFLDGLDWAEFKSLRCDSPVVLDFQDLGVLLEDDAEVVLDAGELFVRHFDAPVREQVHLVFGYARVEELRSLVEEGSFDLRSIHVHQSDFQKAASLVRCSFF